MRLHIRRSKTDPHARGQAIAIPEGRNIRPVKRVTDWLEASGIGARPGYLFQTMRRGGKLTGNPLHPTDVPRIVKHYAARIGLDPRDIAGPFAARRFRDQRRRAQRPPRQNHGSDPPPPFFINHERIPNRRPVARPHRG